MAEYNGGGGGGGGGPGSLVSVDASDTTSGFLASKLVAGVAIALTVLNPGAAETLQASVSGLSLTTLTQVAASPAANQFLKGNGPGVANSWANLFASPANPGDNNKVAIAQSGDFTYELITNANIAPAAVIAVTKLAASATNGQALITIGSTPTWSTNFVAQELTTTGAVGLNATTAVLRIGTNTAGASRAAQSGNVRLYNGGTLNFRNSTDTGDITCLFITAGSEINLGDSANCLNTVLRSSGTFRVFAGTSSMVLGAAFGLTINSGIGLVINTAGSGNGISFAVTTLTPFISHVVATATAGNTLTITAQDTSLASAKGGLLLLCGGDSLNATPGLRGGVRLKLGRQGTGLIVLEGGELTAGNVVLSLVGQVLTTTQMPTSTGNLVIYVGNASTNPSADATAGHIYYSDGAKPAWRFNSTNFRLNGTSATASTGVLAALPALPAGYLDIQVNGTQQKVAYYAA